LRVLGAVDLRDGEGRELRTVLAQPKRVALLAYLALAAPRGGTHRRDKFLALFWPEHDAEHARNALSQALHFLRRTVGADAVVSRGTEELALDASRVWCDAVAFEEALDANRVTDALDLYRGDLFEAFHVADTAPEFDRWLEQERKRLAQRFDGAVERLATDREAAVDFAEAITWWRRLAARDPYSGRITLRLMQALAASGDSAAAIQHARVHERLLRADLDAAVDAEITALIEQLKAAPSGYRPPLPRPSSKAEQPKAKPPRSRRRLTVLAAIAAIAIAGGTLALRTGLTATPAPIRSLAVLPLDNLSPDSAQQSFVDGMHDVLITELARFPDLSVISRTSVMRYRGTSKSVPEIAQELKVDGIIEGAVVRDGGRVRITAQLIRGNSDRHVWVGRYERDLRDVLVLQGDIAEAIAHQVRAQSAPLQPPRRSSAGPRDSLPEELYLRELYRRGRQAELSRSQIGIQTAKEAYRRAIARDSTFALAYAGLAGIYGLEAGYDYAPMLPARDSARMMARRAIALDSMIPDIRAAFAVTLADAGQFEAAEREFRRAIELGPSNPRAHYLYSMLLVVLGRGDEALREARRTLELDPFAPRVALVMERYATWLVTGDRPHFRLPVRERRPILKLEPGDWYARAREAVELAQEGRCDDARAEIRQAQQGVQPGNMVMLPHLGEVLWRCGDRAKSRALLSQMKRRPDAQLRGFYFAWLHTVFGENDSAFVWLERNHWTMSNLSQLSASWVMDPLRSDPRYLPLMQQLGIRK
jgi:TolB-like protein/DNA-binding SARP family transcriptional activator/Flp pilus assembly protein TadD